MTQALKRWGVVCLVVGLVGCRDRSFLTPPTQTLGATLNSPVADSEPRLSYDGRYLVFASDRQSQRNVWLYDVQRRRLLPLPGLNKPNTMQHQPDISADGRYIVYLSEEQGKPDIFVYDRLKKSTERITTKVLGGVRHPTISGNGRFIAFESNHSGQWNIEIYDRGPQTTLSLPGQPANPASPDAAAPTP